MAESAVATATDGTVGEPGADQQPVDWEKRYKDVQAHATKLQQKISEYEKQGATGEPGNPSTAEARELLKKIDPNDPAVPVLERLSKVLAEQENRLAHVNRGVERFHQQDLDMKVSELKARCEKDGFKLDEKALRDTIVEKQLPLYDDDGIAFDLMELAAHLQPEESIRSIEARGVAKYLAAQEAVKKNAVPESTGKSLGDVPEAPGDNSKIKDELRSMFPNWFRS